MPDRPVIGMIVPLADGGVPPECPALYGDRAEFIVEGLGLRRLTPQGYDKVIGRTGELAARLAARGAAAISLMGTSLSFYLGESFNHQLVETMAAASGRPATTMSTAVVDALKALGVTRAAVGTAYAGEVNRRLADFLAANGIDAGEIVSLDIEAAEKVAEVDNADLLALGRRATERNPNAGALFISCGGLNTLEITPVLERETGKPVVSSAVAGAWDAVRLAGLDPVVTGHGRLLQMGSSGG